MTSHLDRLFDAAASSRKKFEEASRAIHGDTYGYINVVYTNNRTPVNITCAIHGDFHQSPSNHARLKRGCPKCAGVSKKTTEEFIKEAMAVHGNKYSYEHAIYSGAKESVQITCPIHGEFPQTPSNHLRGQGCPTCGGAATKTTEEFIREAIAVHGERFSYPNTIYVGAHRKIKIFCNEHEQEFVQTASNHLTHHSCSCKLKAGSAEGFVPSINVRGPRTNPIDYDALRQKFITDARRAHGDRYSYDLVDYKNHKTPVIITCPDHGPFKQAPGGHINGRGCHRCGGSDLKTTTEYISEAKAIHGDMYSYDRTVYANNDTKIEIWCNTHKGYFWMLPHDHVRYDRGGCAECGGVAKKTTEQFVSDARKVHGEEYDYSTTDYTSANIKVSIICHHTDRNGIEHGVFFQTPANHLNLENGCPKCHPARSSYEFEMEDFLTSHGISHEVENKTILAPRHLDFYIPDFKLAIEINGLRFHNDSKKDARYHYDKWQGCHLQGIQLLHINEDEWIESKDLIKSKILAICGLAPKGIGARKLSIKAISETDAFRFAEQYHIQGGLKSIICAVGAFHGDSLVGVMTFSAQRTNAVKIELSRFCSDGKNYPGMFSRMFAYTVKSEGFAEVWSFADRRYSNGHLYKVNGFVHDGDTQIDYRYIDPGRKKTLSKNSFTTKKIKEKYGISGKSEREMMSSLGYHRIYDCGKMRFVWRSP